MIFYKYHALGNDYLVMGPLDGVEDFTAEQVRSICHRNFGVGSDGILLGPLKRDACDLGLRIYNPDGSVAEKSGNGLRIFSRYLWDKGLVADEEFEILTDGGMVRSRVFDGGRSVRVEMGRVSFDSEAIPVEGPPREVLQEEIVIKGHPLKFSAATIGNPHCVILRDKISKEEALDLGPDLEIEPRFPNKTNVQFMQVLDRANIQLEIWERGAGYTLASGSSSSAAAAVAHRLGLCDSDITVHAPGGDLSIQIGEDYAITMTGPVTKVSEGTISEEIFG